MLFMIIFLFAKYFPVVAVAEIKFVLKTSGDNYKREMAKEDEKSLEEFVHENSHH